MLAKNPVTATRPISTWKLLALVPLIALAGCQSRNAQAIRSNYFRGDLAAAESASAERLKKPKGDANVVRLDQAVLQLLNGRPAEAEQNFRLVRDEFDHLQQPSGLESSWSLATDDTRRAYAGEDYERILLRVFLSLSSLFSGSGDASAYAMQVVEEQQRVLQKFTADDGTAPDFKRVATGPYLRAAIMEERFTESADVRRSRVQVIDWEPEFKQGQIDLARLEQGNHSRPGYGVLYVMTLVGRGPHKVQTVEAPTSQALLIADQILSANSKHSLPPTVAPVPVAQVVEDTGGPDAIQVRIAGTPVGQTETVTDVGRHAVEQYAAGYQRVIARAIVRRVLKKGTVYAMKEQFGADSNGLVDAALTLGGVAWEATEKADLRSWDLLPDRIQVLRLELPAGEHTVRLQPLANGQPGVQTDGVMVPIRDGRNTWMLASFPDDRLVGKILVR